MLKKTATIISICFIISVLCILRSYRTNGNDAVPIRVITDDAFGYYLYLPSFFIYKDLTTLNWFSNANQQYDLTGSLYQANKIENGNYVAKYLMGISILTSPFFMIGHLAAKPFGYPQDGFSLPYQLAIVFAAFFYALLGIWILRKILLYFFSESVTNLTLVLICLATNFPQYVSIESGMTHVYLFAMYAILIWLTIRWHDSPTLSTAFFIGLVIGISVITRPTEAVMLFIPLLWQTHETTARRAKWTLVIAHRSHIVWAFFGGLLGILPQLIYWKTVTGSFVYNVGAKFLMADPYFRVLFGFTNGWFVFTPVTILIVLGFWNSRKYPFFRSLVVFFILNTWLVMAWSDWRYGATYSCRALVQCYPLLALPLAAFCKVALESRLKYIFGAVCVALIGINFFQLKQYNDGILDYRGMTYQYYKAIFLNPNPTPLDMSLLDTDERIYPQKETLSSVMYQCDTTTTLNASTRKKILFFEKTFEKNIEKDIWLKVSAEVTSDWGAYDSALITTLYLADHEKKTVCRLQNGISKSGEWNTIEYFFKIPASTPTNTKISLSAETSSNQSIRLRNVKVIILNMY